MKKCTLHIWAVERPDGVEFTATVTGRGRQLHFSSSVSVRIIQEFIDSWYAYANESMALARLSAEKKSYEKTTRDYGRQLLTMILKDDYPSLDRIASIDNIQFSSDILSSRLPVEILPYNRQSFAADCCKIQRDLRFEVNKPGHNLKRVRAFKNLPVTLYSNQTGDLSETVEKEIRILTNTVKNIDFCKKLDWPALLRSQTKDHHIHYCGHASVESMTLSGLTVRPQDIASLNLSHTGIVFLNSCHAGTAGQLQSFAPAFLKAGARCVIGYLGAIESEMAVSVAGSFWKSVRKGAGVDKALNRARSDIAEKYGAGHPAQYLPVLYGFDRQQSGRKFWPLAAAAAVISVILVGGSWFYHDIKYNENEVVLQNEKTTDPAELPKKKNPVHKKPVRPEPKPETHKEQVTVKPAAESKPVPRKEPRGEKVLSIPEASKDFQQLAKEFVETEHPFYDRRKRQQIVEGIYNANIPEKTRVQRLRYYFMPD